jgi:hypothetical protein
MNRLLLIPLLFYVVLIRVEEIKAINNSNIQNDTTIIKEGERFSLLRIFWGIGGGYYRTLHWFRSPRTSEIIDSGIIPTIGMDLGYEKPRLGFEANGMVTYSGPVTIAGFGDLGLNFRWLSHPRNSSYLLIYQAGPRFVDDEVDTSSIPWETIETKPPNLHERTLTLAFGSGIRCHILKSYEIEPNIWAYPGHPWYVHGSFALRPRPLKQGKTIRGLGLKVDWYARRGKTKFFGAQIGFCIGGHYY